VPSVVRSTVASWLATSTSSAVEWTSNSSASTPMRTARWNAYIVLDGASLSPPWWAMSRNRFSSQGFADPPAEAGTAPKASTARNAIVAAPARRDTRVTRIDSVCPPRANRHQRPCGCPLTASLAVGTFAILDRSPEAAAAASAPPAGFQEQTVYSGPNPPINVEFAPDGRVFVAEKGGLYVVTARVSRLQPAGNVMTGSEQVLLSGWCQHFPSRSVGDLRFGTDGMLYVSVGDGASYHDVDYGQLSTPANPCGQRVRRAQDGCGCALGGANGRVLTTVAELGSGVIARLPQSTLRMPAFDSQETAGENGRAVDVLDGIKATLWHPAEWRRAAAPALPRPRRTPRRACTSNLNYGRIARYEFCASRDGNNWGTPPPAPGRTAPRSGTPARPHAPAGTSAYAPCPT